MKLPNIKRAIILIVVLALIECGLVGFIGVWRDWFWSAVNDRNLHLFIRYLMEFSVAAMLACFVSGYGDYLVNCSALIMRTNLTKKALKLQDRHLTEGFGQRVQEDCLSYPTGLIFLIRDGMRNVLTLIIFTVIIWKQLGPLYLLFPLGYALIGTVISAWIAKPLILLNYMNQVFEAKFRQTLTKLHYVATHRNNHKLFKATKFLAYFQSFYSQITVIIPLIMLSGLYFYGKITFGVLMQCASSMGALIESLSYFITSFNNINKFLSCRKRLKELGII